MNNQTVLEVTNLKTHFSVGNAIVKAVDGVSFNLNAGEITAIVGESGSGKSVTSLSIMRLLPSNVVDEEQGIIKFKGDNLLDISEKEMRRIRGNKTRGRKLEERPPFSLVGIVHSFLDAGGCFLPER